MKREPFEKQLKEIEGRIAEARKDLEQNGEEAMRYKPHRYLRGIENAARRGQDNINFGVTE